MQGNHDANGASYLPARQDTFYMLCLIPYINEDVIMLILLTKKQQKCILKEISNAEKEQSYAKK